MCLTTHGNHAQATGACARGLDDPVQLVGLRQIAGICERFGELEDRAINGQQVFLNTKRGSGADTRI